MSNILLAKRREIPNIHKFDSMLAWFNTNVNSRGFIKGVPEVILTNFTDVTNSTTVMTDLHSFTIPANTLFTNGDFLTLTFVGFLANNTNAKVIHCVCSGTLIEGSAGLSQLNGGSNNNWTIYVSIIRLSSTLVKTYTFFRYGFYRLQVGGVNEAFGAGSLNFGRTIDVTVSDLSTNSFIIKAQGQGAATGDVHQTSSIISLTQST